VNLIHPYLPAQLDGYAPFEPVEACDPTAKPGAVALRLWILSDLFGIEEHGDEWKHADLGIGRSQGCEDPSSKHHEGRAWDFHPPTPEEGRTLLAFLLAPSELGEPHELARRAGLRTIIYEGRIWNASGGEWEPHGGNPHNDHIHFGLSRAGAAGETTLYDHLKAERARSSRPPPLDFRERRDPVGARDLHPNEDEMIGPPPCPDAETVEAVRTPLAPDTLAETLAAAWIAEAGAAPSDRLLAFGWAVVNHETGETVSMWNHNFGNLICTSGWQGQTMNLAAGAGQPQWYRGYPDPVSGARAFWRLLRGRYAAALELAEQGDHEGAAVAMGQAGYYTANAAQYARRIDFYVQRFHHGGSRNGDPIGWGARLGPLLAVGGALVVALAAAQAAE
jgi:hypothetical protein